MDVDGVLTDGMVYLVRDQEQARAMNIKDGYALQLAVKKGYEVVVISGAYDSGVEFRLKRLGIKELHFDIKDKATVLQHLAQKHGYTAEQVIFIGDDIPDAAAMKWAGLPCAPADAVQEILSVSKYVSPYHGGKGCVRDIIEKVMKLNDDWHPMSDVVSK